LIALLALLVASPALATSSQTTCGSTTETESNKQLHGTSCVAWRYTADNEDSNGITFKSPTGTICFDPDTGAAGAGTSQIMIWHCPNGIKPSANFGYTCHEILDSALTGLVGASGTQNACIRVGAGTYFSEVTTAPSSENSVVYFQAEGE
jgi:hypothetical protein